MLNKKNGIKAFAQPRKSFIIKCLSVLAVISVLNSGCKKEAVSTEKEFGNGTLTVDCGGKCNVNYTIANDVVDNAEVDRSQATYTIRYKRNNALKINITPTDVDQKVIVNVYSRETKQIYHNEANRKVGEIWSAKIVIP